MSDTPRTDAIVINGTINRFLKLSRQLERELNELRAENERLREIVLRNLPYLENLIDTHGHESGLLKEHDYPCQGFDFCLMKQAKKGADAIREAIDQAMKEGK